MITTENSIEQQPIHDEARKSHDAGLQPHVELVTKVTREWCCGAQGKLCEVNSDGRVYITEQFHYPLRDAESLLKLRALQAALGEAIAYAATLK